MNNDIDLELAQTIDRFDVLSSELGYKNLMDSQDIRTSIEKNPFFVSYNHTDLGLWQNGGGHGMFKKLGCPLKAQIRKPMLEHLKRKTKKMGQDWLKNSLREMENEISWVRAVCPKKSTLKRAYSLNDLVTECDRLIETDLIFRDTNSKEVNELSSYFESILGMPKKMSDMAESMYS